MKCGRFLPTIQRRIATGKLQAQVKHKSVRDAAFENKYDDHERKRVMGGRRVGFPGGYTMEHNSRVGVWG